ncbi:MAG: deoxyribonuclease IV [Nitrososphaerota archaeon]|nr:deoxyribonuclease IV [Nitrososphaerota archaeon]MDG6966635.1 deoxyribonuclease IV [Nitrososphaerota archaeon]MDG6978505.1 deoxyribonuclease IV [Nitrososphaerota archaeon]MDG7021278.1 deoxyribonuclease IV [Nitrososphaerota archaeon]MDG7022200.1 deoxyribonuclease IV [Nitrososphaerota archaeon]
MKRGPMIGFHLSIAGSLDQSVDRAVEMGCTTFQIFTRNPRGWAFKPLDGGQVELFRSKRSRAGFERVVGHMPYLANLATSEGEYQRKSRDSLAAEVARCSSLGIDYLVAHIGSHMGKGTMEGVKNVVAACNQALEADPGRTVIAIETMAGQKHSVGSRFEELRLILDGVKQRKRIGVCFDTCHVFAAGFDLATRPAVEATMGMFEDVVGKDVLRVVHLNDSKGPLGSGLDRHEYVGKGQIGEKGFRAFLHHGEIAALPIIMEVPVEERTQFEENLAVARRLLA